MKSRLFARFMAIGMLLASGCMLALSAACHDPDTAPVSEQYDGETLYRGLMLGQGEVAGLIPEIRDHFELEGRITDKAELAEALAMNDRLVEAIASAQPDFFETFRVEVQSGNHIRIRQALTNAGQVTIAQLATLGINFRAPVSGDVQKCAALNVSVAINLAAVTNVVVAVYVWLFVQVFQQEQEALLTSLGQGDSQILMDQLVDSIATLIATE